MLLAHRLHLMLRVKFSILVEHGGTVHQLLHIVKLQLVEYAKFLKFGLDVIAYESPACQHLNELGLDLLN